MKEPYNENYKIFKIHMEEHTHTKEKNFSVHEWKELI